MNIELGIFSGMNNLRKSDLSHNMIEMIEPGVFPQTIELHYLNLSHNNLTRIESGTFLNMSNLWNLKMSHNKLTCIGSGTFFHTTELGFLDLSHNLFRIIDFAVFPHRSLITFYINDNQLEDLDGLSSFTFPRLESLGIASNKFSCSYLRLFLSIFLRHLKPTENESDLNNPNINGISCTNTKIIRECCP